MDYKPSHIRYINKYKKIISEEKVKICFLFILSAILRMIALTALKEGPGDGPVRAVIASAWSKDPSIQWSGVWPPGYMYLSGIFSTILLHSISSTRILNLILGSFTAPFIYLLFSTIYDRKVAFLSALVLAFFPLHIFLSVTSLTEVSIGFELISSMYFLIIWSESKGLIRTFSLIISVFLLILATMTRYEVWILIPLWPLYYYLSSKNVAKAFILFLLLTVFPISWLIGNFVYSGSILPVFSEAIKVHVIKRTSWQTVKILIKLTRNYMGWFAIIVGGIGLILRIFYAIKGQASIKEIFYLAVLGFMIIFLVDFAIERRMQLLNDGRYFLLIYICIIPIIILPFKRYSDKSNLWMMAIFFFLTVPMGYNLIIYNPEMYLMREHPEEIIQIGRWIENSNYNGGYVLTTNPLGSLIKLYNPNCYYYPVTRDNALKANAFIKITQPSLLIVNKQSTRSVNIKNFLSEKIFHSPLEERIVFSANNLLLYDIKNLVANTPSGQEIDIFKKASYLGSLFQSDKIKNTIMANNHNSTGSK